MGIANGLLMGPVSGPAKLYRRYLWGFQDFLPAASVATGLIARVYLNPIEVPYRIEIDRLGYQVGLTSAGNIRMGLYRQGTVADTPDGGALVVESASEAQVAGNRIQSVIVPDTVLIPGLYYLAWQGDDATATFYAWRDNGGLWPTCSTRGGGYGAFTDPCPATAGVAGDYIKCFMRVKTNLPLS